MCVCVCVCVCVCAFMNKFVSSVCNLMKTEYPNEIFKKLM